MTFDQVGFAFHQWLAEHQIRPESLTVVLRCKDIVQEDRLKEAVAADFGKLTYGPAPNPQFAKFECCGVQFVTTHLDASARVP